MSTSLYSQFKTDQNLETAGIVLNYGQNAKGENIDIRIARAGGSNSKFSKVAEQVLKPFRRQISNESMDPAKLDELFRVIYARSVVLGWTGVEDEDGNPLPFNEANVVKLFNDLPDLFADVRAQAEKQALFRKIGLEEEAGN